jgi:GNAT superfamily N-acetyltransferase
VTTASIDIRRAGVEDVDAIAAAHLDSIRTIGPRYYDAALVREWGARIGGTLYMTAMARGEAFFIAADAHVPGEIRGFSSHRVDAGVHGVAVYVRGRAARCGLGTALLRAAEASAVAAGALTIEIDASLAAVEFYEARGYEVVGRGAHRLTPHVTMPCVFMRKRLERIG